MSSGPVVPDSRKPADTDFKQQRLSAWQPILTPHWVVSCFIFGGAIFIPIGTLILVGSDATIEVVVRYDETFKDCHWQSGSSGTGGDACLRRPGDADCGPAGASGSCTDPKQCGMLARLPRECPRSFTSDGYEWNRTKKGDLSDLRRMAPPDDRIYGGTCDPKCQAYVEFDVTETMESPVYMYYRLTNFYHNHRIFTKSRSDKQLAGLDVSKVDLIDCQPLEKGGQRMASGDCTHLGNSDCEAVPLQECKRFGSASNGERECVDVADGTTTTSGSMILSACGMVAYATFNDSFRLEGPEPENAGPTTTWPKLCDGEAFTIEDSTCENCGDCTKELIAYPGDKEYKFIKPTEPYADALRFDSDGLKAEIDKCESETPCKYWAKPEFTQVLPFFYNAWYPFEPYHRINNPRDEDFMVWMRTQTIANFRKLYRRIDKTLEPGKYRLLVSNRFDTTPFEGEKAVILSQLGWMGGKNHLMGFLYIIVGAIFVLLAAVFAFKQFAAGSPSAAAAAGGGGH